MKPIHLNTTNDSLAGVGLSSDTKQNWISQTVSSLDSQYGLIHQYASPPLLCKRHSLLSFVYHLSASKSISNFFPTLTSSLSLGVLQNVELLELALFHLTIDK